jgi:hypothetical protein
MRRLIVLAGLLLVILCGALSFYLFRRVAIDNPALGKLTIQYYWGRPASVEIDTDRDKTVDGRYILSSETKRFSPHSRYEEGWESSRCNGVFDLHLRFDPSGELATLEYDSDSNGDHDVTVRGLEARQFLRTLQRPETCKPWQSVVD